MGTPQNDFAGRFEAKVIPMRSRARSRSERINNFISLEEGHIKSRGIENLSEFLVQRPQDLLLVESRTDGLADLRQQLVFLGAPLRIVHDDIVLKGEAYLKRETNQQAQV